ncbi:hypothetical protein, partial [Mycobacterium tuberculosis]|uniref:hypothetical protein n=1 Tax=Mycobacterium tuberculosis TaxID=1773 RepID=UPI00197B4FD7
IGAGLIAASVTVDKIGVPAPPLWQLSRHVRRNLGGAEPPEAPQRAGSKPAVKNHDRWSAR